MLNIFAVYKEKGPTSHDVVDQVRRITGVKKVGHAGTLDPLASGILVIAVGRDATKKLSEIVAKEKEYIATIKLGEESSTDDEEGKKIVKNGGVVKDIGVVKNVVKSFIGKIMQTPPIYSALKIKGKSAHYLARRGYDVKLKPRQVEIKEIEILEYEPFGEKVFGENKKWPFLKIRVVTGPGVYIRALARDIGRKLGTGGYLYDLERTRVGEFTKENAVNILKIKI